MKSLKGAMKEEEGEALIKTDERISGKTLYQQRTPRLVRRSETRPYDLSERRHNWNWKLMKEGGKQPEEQKSRRVQSTTQEEGLANNSQNQLNN